jgi:hypothetical protein
LVVGFDVRLSIVSLSVTSTTETKDKIPLRYIDFRYCKKLFLQPLDQHDISGVLRKTPKRHFEIN